MSRVIIAGQGAVTAVGRGIDSFWTAIRANRSGLRASSRFSHARFQSNIVGAVENGEDWEEDDPAYPLAADALRESLEQAAGLLDEIPPTRIGLILATTKANIEALERLSDGRPCSAGARRHLRGDLLAADLASEAGLRGPVQCVSLACVSGLSALQHGAKWIRRGIVDAAAVVGVDHLSAFVVSGFSTLKAIDPEGCRPFDRERRGLSPGEAGGAIVLVRDKTETAGAIALCGWGSSNDANHMTGPSRDGSGLAGAIRTALQQAGLHPGDVDYVNAHGTGTLYNDEMESAALSQVFGAECPPVSALKGMLGHTLGAAGVVETIACALALREKLIPGTPRLQNAAEGVPHSLVKEPRVCGRLRHVLKLSTGFGGINGALVLCHE